MKETSHEKEKDVNARTPQGILRAGEKQHCRSSAKAAFKSQVRGSMFAFKAPCPGHQNGGFKAA
ncbi:MAG: hypothetical protein FWC50_02485 [Planctomycetaceae bacterium]|nr:hypothetical protein [Planctomycetaceae bacterium]